MWERNWFGCSQRQDSDGHNHNFYAAETSCVSRYAIFVITQQIYYSAKRTPAA